MNFIDQFQNRFPFLQSQDFEKFMGIAAQINFKKGDKIIDLGEKKKKVAIILKGIVRGYIINYKGQEVTTFLFLENNAVAAYEPIILNQNTNHTFECLEPTQALLFDYEDLEQLVQQNSRINSVKNAMLMDMLLSSIKRNESFITKSPEKRYLSFIQNQSELLQRVSQKHIASYLGITAVSFSRLKKRIFNQQDN